MSTTEFSKRAAAVPAINWRPHTSTSLSAITAGLALHAMTVVSPQWAIGQTFHLASSSAFRVDLSAGLWGYCRTATFDASAHRPNVEEECYWFYTSGGQQQLSVCEAYTRGFVYGTDDVRGIRLPIEGIEDVHRIERPPTSLDDVNIKRFIEKSCSVEGTLVVTSAITSWCLAFLTLCAFACSLIQDESSPERIYHLQANSTIMRFASVATIASVLLWLQQSWDLRQADDSGVHASIHIGFAAYAQILVALAYFYGALGMVCQDHKAIHPVPSLKQPTQF